MKIVKEYTLISRGAYARSRHWATSRKQLRGAIKSCAWLPGGMKFAICPRSDKERGEGNAVGLINNGFLRELGKQGWTIEAPAKNLVGRSFGRFDAVLPGPRKPIVAKWAMGNISSSHQWMNKLTMLVADGVISAGTLIVASRKLSRYLTDRVGNIRELERYFELWKSIPCRDGVLEIVVIEHDA